MKDADRSFIHIETSLHAEQPVALSSLCSLSTETEASRPRVRSLSQNLLTVMHCNEFCFLIAVFDFCAQ